MRFFPSARRLRRALDRLPVWAHPQWLVTAVAVIVAVAGLAVPLAQADDRDDLKDKQGEVRGQIAGVRGEIQEASAKVSEFSGKLRVAQGKLTAARSRLSEVRTDLANARTRAEALAAKLVTAREALAVAKEELEQAQIEVADQRQEGRDTAIRVATGGDADLALLKSYAEGDTIEDILASQASHAIITGRQQQSLDALVAAEDLLDKRRDAVKDAVDNVAGAKKEADENVAAITRLVDDAETVEAQVAGLVTRTNSARVAVVRARAADRAVLRRLEAREARIKRQILALSRNQGGSYNGSTGGLLARPGPGPVTSPYGYRIHPIYGYYGLHNGIDFGTGCGARLVAGESGTVINRYFDEVYGNRLYVAIGRVNGASIVLVYNHLSSYAVGQGARVRRGQTVGYSGSTGWSTGCHLHFIVLRNGEPVDPARYL